MGAEQQTVEHLALGWVKVTPAAGAPYYAHAKTQATSFTEPQELREHRAHNMELVHASTAEDVDRFLFAGAELNCQDPMGVSPVMKAAMLGNCPVLERLLEEKPDLSLREAETGRTALHLAVCWGHCVNMRIRKGELEKTPGGTVGALIRAGCSLEDPDGNGETVLQLSCRALEPRPEFKAEREPIMARLLSVGAAWNQVFTADKNIGRLMRAGKFVVAVEQIDETLVTVAETLDNQNGVLTDAERADFEKMQEFLVSHKERSELGAKRRDVELQLAMCERLARVTVHEVDEAMVAVDAALMAYHDLADECHGWPEDDVQDWRDVEEAGVSAGLEEAEGLRAVLLKRHFKLEEEHTADLERMDAEERKSHVRAQVERQEKQRIREEVLAAAKKRWEVRLKAQADAEAKEAALLRAALLAATAEERAAEELAEREREAYKERFNAFSSAKAANRLVVKKEKRMKRQRRRMNVMRSVVGVDEVLVGQHLERERAKINRHSAAGAEAMAATNGLRQDLSWKSPPEEWHNAIEIAVDAISRYESAMAVWKKSPGALSAEASTGLAAALEAAHELADVVEEEAHAAEIKASAHQSVMNATGELRRAVAEKVSGTAAGLEVDVEETEKEQLERVKQTLEVAAAKPKATPTKQLTAVPMKAPQPPKPRSLVLRGTSRSSRITAPADGAPGSASARLAAQVGAKVAQRQHHAGTTGSTGMDAHNEGILRAQKSARRRIVEDVRRKTAVEKLLRAYDTNSMVATGTDFGDTQTTLENVSSGMMGTNVSFYSQGSEGLAYDYGCSLGTDQPGYARQAPPPWIEEAHSARSPHMVSFRSPREITLSTEAEYKRSIAGQPKPGNHRVDQSTPRVASKGAIDARRPIGIQGTSSVRSFPDALPVDLPAALYMTMQQREQARAQKEAEQLAREDGWRANQEVDPTPVGQRVYKYGDAKIKVGGRASSMVDQTVFEIRKEKGMIESARRGYYGAQAGSWEESLRQTMPTEEDVLATSLSVAASHGRRAAAGSITTEPPTAQELDRCVPSPL